MKPKKIKARKMVASVAGHLEDSLIFLCHSKNAIKHNGDERIEQSPVYVLPADAASVDAMVEQMAQGMHDARWSASESLSQNEYARAALAAIGIK